MEDGRVLSCISEERLNRQKEWKGFPERSILRCLETAGREAGQVDAIGVCALLPQTGHRGYHRPGMAKRLFGHAARIAPPSLLQREGNIGLVQFFGGLIYADRNREYRQKLGEMGFRCQHRLYEHHRLHAATAYYTNWHRPDPALVLTLDGSGDAVSATVSIGEKNRLRRLSSTFNYNSICEFYTRVTQYLGMKPMSQEYKVMGLAPYADPQERNELLAVFRSYFRLAPANPMQFLNTSGKWKWQFMDLLHTALDGKRFDVISGAVQDLFEEIVHSWIRQAVRRTGIGHLAVSGGGFMNIKLNGKILDMPEVESLFVFPSCGDESNSVGAAILSALDHGYPAVDIRPLETISWGPRYTPGEIRAALDRVLPPEGFKVSRHENIDDIVGRAVAGGKIVGRLTGRMEWGARALGNRSIVADPRSSRTIRRINKMIKRRDFWMPFSPAVLSECRARYLHLRDGHRCPFMTVACETTEVAEREIPAALHPFDRTARPQLVDREVHRAFHRMIRAFQGETGVGAVLNTSFNIHGEPIVNSPEDALNTLLRSELDAVQLEDHFVERTEGPRPRSTIEQPMCDP
jgi:carbamoyltransferase